MSRSPRRPRALGSTLPDLAGLIGDMSDRQSRLILRLRFREDEIGCRWKAKRLRGSERIADNLAKFGGGSLLTATVAFLLGRQPIWQVLVLSALTLSSFIVGTILSAVLDARATAWDTEGDRLHAA